MADKTFDILIDIRAQLEGVTQASAQLKQLAADAAAITAEQTALTSASASAGGVKIDWKQIAQERASAMAATTPIEAQSVVNAEELAAAQAKTQLLMERRVIIETELEAAEARIAGNPAMAAKLERESEIRIRALAVQNALNVSTEESIVLAERLVMAEEATVAPTLLAGANLNKAKGEAIVLARELATGSFNARTMGAFLGSLGTTITIASLVGYELYQVIGHSADEAVRLNTEYQKSADSLFKDVEAWQQLAKEAQNFSEVIKVAEAAQSKLNTLTEKSAELNHQQLSISQKIGDLIPPLQPFGPDGKDVASDANKQQLEAAQKAAKDLATEGLAAGITFVEAAQKSQAAWEKFQDVALDQAVATLTKNLADLKAKQADISTVKDQAGLDAWVKGALDIQLATRNLDDFQNTQAKVATEAAKVSAEVQKIDFKQLDKSDELAALNTELSTIQNKLREVGVEAASPNEALTQQAGLTKANAEEVIKLAGAWAKVLAAISQVTSQVASLAGAQFTQGLQDSLTHAQATGTSDDVYKAQYALTYNDILEKRNKLNLDNSAETINQLTYEKLLAPEHQKELAALEQGSGAHKEINELLREESDMLKQIRLEQKLISESPFLGVDAKQTQLHALFLAEQQQLSPEIIKVQKALDGAYGPLSAEQVARLTEKMRELRGEVTELGFKIETTTFSGALQKNLTDWANNFGTSATQIGNLITGSINQSLQATNTLLLDAVFRTGNWKQTVVGLERSILNMFLTTIEQMAIQAIMSKVHTTSNAATQVGANAAITASAAPAAAATSVATSGWSAIAGEIAAVAAIAAIIALLSGGFAEGGFTGGSSGQVAGFVHGKEYVQPERTVNKYGADLFEAFRQGQIPVDQARSLVDHMSIPVQASSGAFDVGGLVSSNGPGLSLGGGSPKIELFHFSDPNRMADAILKSDAGILGIIDAVSGNFHLIKKNAA